jgi:hypothetical protein
MARGAGAFGCFPQLVAASVKTSNGDRLGRFTASA